MLSEHCSEQCSVSINGCLGGASYGKEAAVQLVPRFCHLLNTISISLLCCSAFLNLGCIVVITDHNTFKLSWASNCIDRVGKRSERKLRVWIFALQVLEVDLVLLKAKEGRCRPQAGMCPRVRLCGTPGIRHLVIGRSRLTREIPTKSTINLPSHESRPIVRRTI